MPKISTKPTATPVSGDYVPFLQDQGDGTFLIMRAAFAALANQAHVAASDPAATDDSSEGFAVGSAWLNTTDDALFIATDVTEDAAVWAPIGGSGAEALDDLTDVDTAGASDGDVLTYDSDTATWVSEAASGGGITQVPIVVACSDETSDLTTGTAKATFRMPFAATLDSVKADVTEAPTGGPIQTDINEEGTSVLSTPITIDAGEGTSVTAATPPVISDAALADNAKVTIDVDAVGSTTPGKGLKVTLMVTPA